jgi:hypothetical protein
VSRKAEFLPPHWSPQPEVMNWYSREFILVVVSYHHPLRGRNATSTFPHRRKCAFTMHLALAFLAGTKSAHQIFLFHQEHELSSVAPIIALALNPRESLLFFWLLFFSPSLVCCVLPYLQIQSQLWACIPLTYLSMCCYLWL